MGKAIKILPLVRPGYWIRWMLPCWVDSIEWKLDAPESPRSEVLNRYTYLPSKFQVRFEQFIDVKEVLCESKS